MSGWRDNSPTNLDFITTMLRIPFEIKEVEKYVIIKKQAGTYLTDYIL
jgi:hypothetical protein